MMLSYETCYFCGLCRSTDDAVEAGWVPSFWRDGDEIFEPVCRDCCKKHLVVGDDGEMELRSNH